ncbi:MAG TPA: N-acetyltransferase [candidate division Zixibacteria bacterium]|nr:N-acetyltransferase [candidate division Zixibacteria bacterium]
MASVEIVEVSSPSQLKKFVTYPNQLYKGDPNYVTPLVSERLEFLDKQKNPFFQTASTKEYLAKRDGKIVGRIGTCVNYAHNQHHLEKVGFFGFLDLPDDYDVLVMMMRVAMINLKKVGMEKLRGPVSYSTNHECGALIEGFDLPPKIMMPYNKPYLPQLLEKFGFKKAMDLFAYRITKEMPIPDRVLQIADKLVERAGATIRPLKMSRFDEEVEKIHQIYNAAWEENWGFVPMTKEEFFYMGKNLKQIVDPKVALILEVDKKPIGFALALPDIKQALIRIHGKLFPFGLAKLLWDTKVRNKIDSLRVLTMGVVPEFRGKGLDMVLYSRIYLDGTKAGYNWAEMSWILESNQPMNSAIERMGAELYKKYRIYEMPI